MRGAKVPRCQGAKVLGAVVLGAVVLGAAVLSPAICAAQAQVENARIETRRVTRGLEQEVNAVAARAEASWIAYRVPLVSGPRQMCCDDAASGAGGCCGRCRLDGGSGVSLSMSDGSSANGSRIMLEPPTELLVFARVSGGEVGRVRLFTPDCDIDAGGMPLVWLNDVRPDDSVAWLTTLIASAAQASKTRDQQVVQTSLAAIAMHQTASALPALFKMARDDSSPRVRGSALFWLSQRAGQQAAAAITNAITNDPDTEVMKKAVFALSQMPKDDGIPKLIEVARTNRNPEVRKQAMFWLGESKDPRALAFFEEILAAK